MVRSVSDTLKTAQSASTRIPYVHMVFTPHLGGQKFYEPWTSSLSDWDFMHGDTYRSLSPDRYISEPTSLKYSGAPGLWTSLFLCRIPSTLCLPQGEIRCHFYDNLRARAIVAFRHQAPLGSADEQNFYWVWFTDIGEARLFLHRGGSGVQRDSTEFIFNLNEWNHLRVSWYNGKTPAEEDALCVDIYREVAGEWIKQGSTMYDTLNNWKDSDVNRCGFRLTMAPDHIIYFDDTEIWGADTTYDLSTNSAAYGNRILLIDHAEEAYNDYAVVILRDYDRTLPNLLGYWTEIGYGDVTGGGNEYAATPRLWVKHQQHISAAGKLLVILELEGMWSKLRETKLRMGSPPYYIATTGAGDFGAAKTAYGIIEYIIENEIDPTMALNALVEDDSIINTLQPAFEVNNAQPFEDAGQVIYRLLKMTKSFLRPQNGMAWKVKYPQDSDPDDLTYYSNQSPYFYEYVERKNLLVPNRIYLFANAGSDGLWTNIITGQADDTDSQTAYGIVAEIVTAPEIDNQADADARAAAILQRWRAEWVGGRLIIPHDCQMELYDRLKVHDRRT